MKPIAARDFGLSMLGLIVVLVGIDAVVLAQSGEHDSWWSLVVPTMIFGFPKVEMATVQAVAAVLFCLIGYWLTLRRVLTVALPFGYSLLFFVPLFNFVNAIMLTFRPTQAHFKIEIPERARIAAKAIAYTVVVGVAYTVFSVFVLKSYGWPLFLASPLVYGALAGYIANRDEAIGTTRTQAIAAMGITFLGGALLLLALEGFYCILMAAPLAYGMAAIGAAIGQGFASYNNGKAVALLLIALPVTGALDHPTPPQRLVTSTIEIAAPPEKVWKYIVDVPNLPPPTEFMFRNSIAYPLKAYARSHKVGAQRVCVFDTGDALETITALQPGVRLKFHIDSQPDSMRELSPYKFVNAPHLHGFVESEDGEFILRRLPNGHTLLTGNSWYRSYIAPGAYWTLLSDHFVHMIHFRVFAQIKRLSEAS